ncbi:MAG: protein kinase [Gemmataceae bacterium]
MNNQTTSRNSIPLLNELVTDYFRALEAGGRPNPEDWVARYPEYASELREFFEGHLHVDLIAGPLREAIPLSETTPFAQQGTVSIPFGPGACFADYELLDEIARGGMGVVFKAKQRSLNRIVAVKMIRPDVVAAHDMSRFFHSEAEIAAHLDHPNIVPVYEVGQHDGQHYFSMKLIDGPSLGQFLSREIETKGFENGRLAPCVCVDLLVPIARAVHHAHQRGILHRDLKPSNILLEGSNSESMTPFVSDFGLAKRIDKDQSQTITGEIIGTPLYMSPEQATGEKRITTATDVYSLGAILYEILAGRPPFQSDNLFDTLWQVRHREPDSPRKFNRKVDRDLETICRKCLEKEPAQRYGSAEALADDLDRWRKGEPIQARRASAWEQCRKWVKRQPAIASMGLAIVALIGIVIGVLFVRLGQTSARLSLTETRAGAYQKQAEDRRRDVERSKRETQLVQAHLALEKGMNRIEQGQIGPGLLWLARGLEVVPPDATELNHSLRMLLGGWRNSLFTLEGGLPFRSELDAVALSPDGKIAFVGGPISAQLWDLAAGKRLGPLLRYGGEQLLAVNFSADNKEVTTLVGGESATLQRWNVQNGKRVGKPWSLASPKEQRDGAYPYFCSAAFSADGKRVLTGSFRDQMTYQARLWDPTVARMQTGENPCLRELQIPTDRTRDFHVALSADGKLALRWNNTGRDGGLLDNAILCWNIGKGEMTKRRIRYDGRIGAASVDPVQTTFKSR